MLECSLHASPRWWKNGRHPISLQSSRRDNSGHFHASCASLEDHMMTFTRRQSALLPIMALVQLSGLARAAELNPAAVTYKLPDQIPWSPPSPAGVQGAVLVGDPEKEGLYVQMVKWLAGNHFSHPHFHPHDRFITVLKGTWWVGTGTKFDPDATVPMPAGTFVTHYGQQVHFDGAKDEDAVLLIVGEGPGTATPAEVK
jgi:quercetin dioxygenase-like cupin family protein